MTRAAILALLLIAACSLRPRSVSHFKAHAEETGKVLADCVAGTHRGEECANAQSGADQIRSDQRLSLYKKSF